MRRTIGLAVVFVLAGAVGYGWYFFNGPVPGLKIPSTPRGMENEALAAMHAPESEPAEGDSPRIALPTIAIEPSLEEIENFPARITIRDGAESLVTEYTGQFRRNKVILGAIGIDIYDIASYVAEPAKDGTWELLEGLLVDGKAKIYMIRFLNNLPGRPLMNDIYKDINTEFTDVDLERFQDNVDTFCSQFKDGSRRGDTVYMVWLSDGRVYSAYNTADPLALLVHDVPFARALWRNWAGPRRGDLRFNLVRQYAEDAVP
ncbi:MAG: hypothetical protein KF708_04800 [Pirellulales bacterium]|nr:hypothetical protein [Pirellulales bacterium]